MTGTRYGVGAAAIGLAAILLIVGVAVGFSSRAHGRSSDALARETAREFFQTINARTYEKTCGLLATEFFRANRVRNRSLCALALKIEFTWAPNYTFRIVGVRVDGRRAFVDAVANGAPGEVELVQEDGRFKVVSLSGK